MSAVSKKTLYVGGIDDSVDEKALTELFTPFGDLASVILPIDEKNDKKRGFAFIEFEEGEDAFQAMDNLNKSEFYGRVLSISIAKPDAVAKNRAVWDNPEYFEKKTGSAGTEPAAQKNAEGDAMELEGEGE